mgnify:FL=1
MNDEGEILSSFLFEISYCQISGKVKLKNVKLTIVGW